MTVIGIRFTSQSTIQKKKTLPPFLATNQYQAQETPKTPSSLTNRLETCQSTETLVVNRSTSLIGEPIEAYQRPPNLFYFFAFFMMVVRLVSRRWRNADGPDFQIRRNRCFQILWGFCFFLIKVSFDGHFPFPVTPSSWPTRSLNDARKGQKND